MESQPYLGPYVLHIHHFLIDDACITHTVHFVGTTIISCSTQELPFLIFHLKSKVRVILSYIF